MISDLPQTLNALLHENKLLNKQEAHALVDADAAILQDYACQLRDKQFKQTLTFSKKVFIPLTELCRDVCHYCTFAKTPKKLEHVYLSIETVLERVKQAELMGCKEALFTLGEKPELRYNAARKALAELGYATTIEYLTAVAKAVVEQTNVLPHINAGCLNAEEITQLRKVSASMGLMLESSSARLCEKGMPHYGSPDKQPEKRLETLRLAGQQKVPFTSGILIGIGETRTERIQSLLDIRDVHLQYGNIQEIIIQNFRAKPNTLMANAPEPDLNELLWTLSVARCIFGAQMSIQVPPNLSPGVLPQLVAAGINDWGGVSPVTPDYVNPEAPWPELNDLSLQTRIAGKQLAERLTIYPAYIAKADQWLDPGLKSTVLQLSNGQGLGRSDSWLAGKTKDLPSVFQLMLSEKIRDNALGKDFLVITEKLSKQEAVSDREIARLFEARGDEFNYLLAMANKNCQLEHNKQVSYIINRNINYTNICYFKCQFCAFSKGKASENLRGKPYDLSADEIIKRCTEAWERGATEVCLQGGIHPDYTGQTYLDIVKTIKDHCPELHIHAFSPLEVWQGAETLGLTVHEFLSQLKSVGLNSLPGTAAEILVDEVREILCGDKISAKQWLEVMRTAHAVGLRSTATMMFGHIENYMDWAQHLLAIKSLQQETGGFTEFVPLAFVSEEAPIYLKGNARKGPTLREAVLVHSIARLVLMPEIKNIQTSWVKMGLGAAGLCLDAGANDIGGSLMNESITRSAGAAHGQEFSPLNIEAYLQSRGKQALLRTTFYQPADRGRYQSACEAEELAVVQWQRAGKQARSKLAS